MIILLRLLEKPCENPQKSYNSSISKWFCGDCNEHICRISKEAHEKLRPYGTILEFHNGNDQSFNPGSNDPVDQPPWGISHLALFGKDWRQFLKKISF